MFPDMLVKSRNSSFAFKEQIKTVGEISEELGVDYVVEGSIRKSSDRVRITVQLVEAKSGNQVWGNRYDAALDDIFELEEKLSTTIAANVTGRIESDLQKIAISKSAGDRKAYDLLLEAIYHNHKFTSKDTAIALEKLYQCLKLEPDNSRAHAHLYGSHAMDWLERWTEDPGKSFKLAGEHAQKALELAPDSSIVQIANTEYRTFCRDYEAASTLIDKALKTNPNDPEAHCMKGFLLNMTGEYEDALASAKRCMELDPYHSWGEWIIGENYMLSGEFEKSIETLENSRTSPSHNKPWMIMSHMKLGNEEKARSLMKEPFLLVFQEDFTCREAAELLNIPLGTVLSRIHRARQFMRRFLRQLDSTDEPEVVAPHTPYKRNGEQ